MLPMCALKSAYFLLNDWYFCPKDLANYHACMWKERFALWPTKSKSEVKSNWIHQEGEERRGMMCVVALAKNIPAVLPLLYTNEDGKIYILFPRLVVSHRNILGIELQYAWACLWRWAPCSKLVYPLFRVDVFRQNEASPSVGETESILVPIQNKSVISPALGSNLRFLSTPIDHNLWCCCCWKNP